MSMVVLVLYARNSSPISYILLQIAMSYCHVLMKEVWEMPMNAFFSRKKEGGFHVFYYWLTRGLRTWNPQIQGYKEQNDENY